jgi:hypothetical protein
MWYMYVLLNIDYKELENVEHLKYLVYLVTNDARCMSEIKSRIYIVNV